MLSLSGPADHDKMNYVWFTSSSSVQNKLKSVNIGIEVIKSVNVLYNFPFNDCFSS